MESQPNYWGYITLALEAILLLDLACNGAITETLASKTIALYRAWRREKDISNRTRKETSYVIWEAMQIVENGNG
jgi:hypothetical protein